MNNASFKPMIGPGVLLETSLFHRFKQRALAVQPDELDPLLVELIATINRFDGVATVWSCSGHSEQHPSPKEKIYCKRDKYGYLTWVGHELELPAADYFYQKMTALIRSKPHVFHSVCLTRSRSNVLSKNENPAL
jgi:tRNA(Phe) wybutosine-synthesizing methylase Tyw3